MNQIIDHEPDASDHAPAAAFEKASCTELVLARNAAPSIIKADREDEDLLGKLAAEIEAFKPDISTASGREAIKKLRRKVSFTKARLVEKASAMKADALKLQRAVNAEVNVLEERMDALRDRVGLELDEWEQIEIDRVATHERLVAEMAALREFGGVDPTPAQISDRLDALTKLRDRDWQEFRARATEAYTDSFDRLGSMMQAAQRREREAAELAELRAHKAEADRIRGHRDALAQLALVAVIDTGSGPDGAVTAMDAKLRIDLLNKPSTRDWQEYAVQANETRAMAVQRLTALHAKLEAAEAAAQAERDRKIAEEAAAEATRQAAETAARVAAETAQREERQKQEQAAAEARADQERQAREASEARQEQRRKADHEQVIAAIRAAAERGITPTTNSQVLANGIEHVTNLFARDWEEYFDEAEAARAAAVGKLTGLREAAIARETAAREAAEQQAREEERKKLLAQQAQEQAAASAAQKKREADRAHRGKINRKATDALMVAAALTEETAQAIVVAIARGEIPAVSIAY
jgi:hypothetical protein